MADSDITIVGFTATGGASQNVLQWSINDPNVSGLSYRRFKQAQVWRSTAANMAGATQIDANNAFTAFVDLPVARGQRYFYQVRAVDVAGNVGAFSDIRSATEISGDVLLNINGYWRLPVGLIIQWGFATSVASPRSVMYPIPFPNRTLNVVTFPFSNNPLAHAQVSSFYNVTGEGFDILARIISKNPSTGVLSSTEAAFPAFYWIAIGF